MLFQLKVDKKVVCLANIGFIVPTQKYKNTSHVEVRERPTAQVPPVTRQTSSSHATERLCTAVGAIPAKRLLPMGSPVVRMYWITSAMTATYARLLDGECRNSRTGLEPPVISFFTSKRPVTMSSPRRRFTVACKIK